MRMNSSLTTSRILIEMDNDYEKLKQKYHFLRTCSRHRIFNTLEITKIRYDFLHYPPPPFQS